MKVYDMIVALEQQGKNIKYVKRKDGGYRITQIGRKKYTGKEGNKTARSMLGQSLSEKQKKQRAAASKKAVSPKSILKRRVTTLFKKTSKLMVEKGEQAITPDFREKLETKYGTGKRLIEVLQHKVIALSGLAYTKAVETIIGELEYERDFVFSYFPFQDQVESEEHKKLDKIIKKMNRMKNNFPQDLFEKIRQTFYEWAGGQISEQDMIDIIFDDLNLTL